MLPHAAMAQTSDRTWTGPNGAFSLVIPGAWQRIDAYVDGNQLLAIGPSPEVARRENRNLEVCSVEGRPLRGGPFSQPEINALMDSLLAQLPSELNSTTVHSTNAETQGEVRVISLDIVRTGQDGRPTRQMQRAFALPTDTGLVHYQIGCGASGAAYGAADYDAMRGFMASLIVSTGTDE
jgi:hypothetical protein